jgi:glycosyltransferase involved in cell wall biosynthesis
VRTLFVSWSVQHGRSRDLAAALGADAVFVGVRRRRRRWLTPLRYVVCVAVTTKLFLTRRPKAIFVMMPPLPLAVLALLYGRVARVPVALDAHTGAARAAQTGRQRRSLEVLARFATVTIVTNSELADPLRALGRRTVVLHDPLPQPGGEVIAAADEFTVVAPLSWAPDEPIAEIIGAAAQCPGTRFVLTGRAPEEVRSRRDLPANIELAGFLDADAFQSLLAQAGVVLALTTRDATMQRAGYEAMTLGRPVIASDTRVLREFFADAALFATTAAEIAEAVEQTRSRGRALAEAMTRRREEVRAEIEEGVAQVRAAMGLRA